MSLCRKNGCERDGRFGGLCAKHRALAARHGAESFASDSPCTFSGCTKTQKARGLCINHYAFFMRNGHLNYTPRIADMKAHRKAYVAKWKRDNWADYSAYLKARKKHVKRATPSWADLGAITKFYKACPNGMHVDHIIPLRGERVSGLHVLSNLQYLTAKANMSKGMQYTPVRYDPLGLRGVI